MPLPITHSAAGLAGYLALKGKKHSASLKEEGLLLGSALLLANLPDLDFIPGFILGEPNKFHHGISHSLIIGLVAGVIFYFFTRNKLKEISRWRVLSLYSVAIVSHPILDYFSKDTSSPYGIPLFWPLNKEYFISPISLFRDVQRHDNSIGNFFMTLINRNNSLELVIEILFAGTILFAIFGLQTRPDIRFFFRPFLASFICVLIYLFIQVWPGLM